MGKAQEEEKLAVQSGYWPLYRYDPRNEALGKNPLTLDSAKPSVSFSEVIQSEARFRGMAKDMGKNGGEAVSAYDKE